MWNTGGTREIAITPDNGKLKLVESDKNPLKYSSLNLLEKVNFNSGGRVVAGSNPVTPTDEKSLIFNRISRVFLLWYIARKVAVVHKWYINGRYPKFRFVLIWGSIDQLIL